MAVHGARLFGADDNNLQGMAGRAAEEARSASRVQAWRRQILTTSLIVAIEATRATYVSGKPASSLVRIRRIP